jgi:hypothetical protein
MGDYALLNRFENANAIKGVLEAPKSNTITVYPLVRTAYEKC